MKNKFEHINEFENKHSSRKSVRENVYCCQINTNLKLIKKIHCKREKSLHTQKKGLILPFRKII